MLRGILCSLSYNFQQIPIAQIAALHHESPLFILGILDFLAAARSFFLISSRAFCNASISFLFLEVVVANGAMAAKLSVLALAFSAFFSLAFFFHVYPQQPRRLYDPHPRAELGRPG